MLLFVAAAIAALKIPDRHFYAAHWAVDNAVTCVAVESAEAIRLTGALRKLEAAARKRGLGAEIQRQRRELLMDYSASLRIPCAGGKHKAFGDAHLALQKLEGFIAARPRR